MHAGSTFVIDPEFGFYGPMGFEVGALLANFLLAYFSQAGHGNGPAYADWVLEQVGATNVSSLFSFSFKNKTDEE